MPYWHTLTLTYEAWERILWRRVAGLAVDVTEYGGVAWVN